MFFKTDEQREMDKTKPHSNCGGKGYYGHGGKGAATRKECNCNNGRVPK